LYSKQGSINARWQAQSESETTRVTSQLQPDDSSLVVFSFLTRVT